MNDRTQAERDAEYERERKSAEDDGTALSERTDDMPPPDLFHAAQELALRLDALPGGEEAARELNLALDTPALWGMLDVKRAASVLHDRYPSHWNALVNRFPWLDDAAESGEEDAVGAMADQF